MTRAVQTHVVQRLAVVKWKWGHWCGPPFNMAGVLFKGKIWTGTYTEENTLWTWGRDWAEGSKSQGMPEIASKHQNLEESPGTDSSSQPSEGPRLPTPWSQTSTSRAARQHIFVVQPPVWGPGYDSPHTPLTQRPRLASSRAFFLSSSWGLGLALSDKRQDVPLNSISDKNKYFDKQNKMSCLGHTDSRTLPILLWNSNLTVCSVFLLAKSDQFFWGTFVTIAFIYMDWADSLVSPWAKAQKYKCF